MQVGEPVLFYTHVGSDVSNTSRDEAAIITRVYNEELSIVDLVVFPPGGPVRFVQVGQFDEANPGVAGASYWRGIDDEAPDFNQHPYLSDSEWLQMMSAQRGELAAAPPQERNAIAERHAKERGEMANRLAERHPEWNQEKPSNERRM